MVAFAGALSRLTRTPENVIITKGDNVSMECSTDALNDTNPIQWNHDGNPVTTGVQCKPQPLLISRYSFTSPNPLHDCFLIGLGSSTHGNQGPYHCSDGTGKSAAAVAVLIGINLLFIFLLCVFFRTRHIQEVTVCCQSSVLTVRCVYSVIVICEPLIYRQ